MLSKISTILLSISEGGGQTLTEIAARAGLPLSTVHRLATELAAWQVLERGENGRYRAGAPLRRMGGADGCSSCGARQFIPGIRDRAAPVMEDLFRATGAKVRVGFLDGLEVAYVEKVSAHLPVSWPSPAARLPAHATALGKALLAFAPPSQLRAVLAQGLTQYTPRTVTRPERLRWGLQSVRVTRIAICDRELHPDWCAVAAPVIGAGGEAVAAIELQVRGLAQDVPTVKAPLVVASACFSRELLQSGCLCTARGGLLAATV